MILAAPCVPIAIVAVHFLLPSTVASHNGTAFSLSRRWPRSHPRTTVLVRGWRGHAKVCGLAAILCALLAGAAAATGYSDFNAGIDARNNGDGPTAVDLLGRAIAAPDLDSHLLPVAHLARGDGYVLNKQFALAFAEYQTALQLRPGWYDAYVSRSGAYMGLGDTRHALADLASAAAQRPWQSAAYLASALIYAKANDFDHAVQQASAALAVDDSAIAVVLFRAGLYRRKGDYGSAIADDNHAVALADRLYYAHLDRGLTHQAAGDIQAATDDFTAALSRWGKDPQSRFYLGTAQWEQGNYSDAVDTFITAAKLKPDDYRALWLTLARVAANRSPDLDDRPTGKDWPAPVLAYYAGTRTAEAAMAASAMGDADNAAMRRCEAQFYIGEWHRLHGEMDAARSMLKAAADTCPFGALERAAAAVSMKRLP